MIRIRKPKPPAVLTTRGTLATDEMKAARRGTKHFEFDRSIYAHDDVKATLREAQNDKCAFCESKITHIGYGDVEHFRPKGGVCQNEEDDLLYPGYYWLAYEWSNLFLSCQLCNQRFKRNRFPLRNPKQRIRSHKGNLSREVPLLIDPAGNPENHLTFLDELIVPESDSEHGRVTIEVLALNRNELLDRRRDKRNVLIALREAYTRLSEHMLANPSTESNNCLRRIQSILESAIADNAEYAAMARVTLA